MAISLTEFRNNAYQLARQVMQTGMPLEIVHNRHKLRLVAENMTKLTDRHVPHLNIIVGDPDELERIDWSKEWRPNL